MAYFILLIMRNELFSLLNNLKDIICGHVRTCVMLSINFWTIFIRFDTKIYRQIVGIPKGTYCAPLVAHLFLFCYERVHVVSF